MYTSAFGKVPYSFTCRCSSLGVRNLCILAIRQDIFRFVTFEPPEIAQTFRKPGGGLRLYKIYNLRLDQQKAHV